ncbi:MAG: glycosyltransferase [Polaromonas sp.]|nr:glycosyltransferase [Polaromonas sp.]
MSAKLFIQAMNVHSGGGRSLLRALLTAAPSGKESTVLLDARMETHALPQNWIIRTVRPSLLQRLRAEWWLSGAVGEGDLLLCFGNLPPLFKTRGRAVVFLQNRYLIERGSLRAFPLRARMRLGVERLWFAWRAAHVERFIVQTPSMRNQLVGAGLARGKPVDVLPFIDAHTAYRRRLDVSSERGSGDRFIYVASGEPHKNHRSLIEAWCILATQEIFPELVLTVDRVQHAELCDWLDEKIRLHGLRVINHGACTPEQIANLYRQVDALVFPSTFESFGLPLIEARQAGLPVVASELDFVRDVLDPEESFDPASPVSIARAIKRFVHALEAPLPLMSAGQFLEQLTEKSD